jgi:hypothetical protein
MDRILGFLNLRQPQMCLLACKIVTGAKPAPPYLDRVDSHQ